MQLLDLAMSRTEVQHHSLGSSTLLGRFVPTSLMVLRQSHLRVFQIASSVVLYYNAPLPPSEIFDAFLRIPNLQQDIRTRSYADLVKNQASQGATPGDR